jgi:NADH dehydrogenase FAD-containing subunit
MKPATSMPPRVVIEVANALLNRPGVQVRLPSFAPGVGPVSATLTDGSEIPAGTIVWATGVRAPPLADSLGLAPPRSARTALAAPPARGAG